MNKFKKSYITKIVSIFTLLNVLSVLIAGSVFYCIMKSVIDSNYKVVVEDTGNQIIGEIDKKTEEIRRISNTFVFDQSFHGIINKKYGDYDRQDILNNYLLPKGNTSMVLSDIKINMKLYVDNETIPEYYYSGETLENEQQAKKFEVLHTNRIKDTDYYNELIQNNNYNIWKQVENDEKLNNISFLVKLTNFSTMKKSGFLRITAPLSEVFGDALPSDFQQKLGYSIKNIDNKEIYTTRPIDLDLDKCINITVPTKIKAFSVDLSMAKSNINTGAYKIFVNVFIVVFACLILTFLIVLVIRRILSKNIAMILEGIKNFKSGNYDYRIEIKGDDEFSQIAESLNSFSQSIDHLINDVYEGMLQKQDAEFQMLQAKINPHFMYNIFSIISQLSHAKKNDEIISIVEMTAKFYRSTLSKNSENNTLADEIRILDDYFNIINIQRQGGIEKKYIIEEKALKSLTPNFILQPIVENCVKHAMINGKVLITVKIEIDDCDVVITIADNGIGMTKEQVDQLFKYKPNSGYGLYNINERIRLRCHDPRHTIMCKSMQGHGTAIILRLPLIIKEEDEGE